MPVVVEGWTYLGVTAERDGTCGTDTAYKPGSGSNDRHCGDGSAHVSYAGEGTALGRGEKRREK